MREEQHNIVERAKNDILVRYVGKMRDYKYISLFILNFILQKESTCGASFSIDSKSLAVRNAVDFMRNSLKRRCLITINILGATCRHQEQLQNFDMTTFSSTLHEPFYVIASQPAPRKWSNWLTRSFDNCRTNIILVHQSESIVVANPTPFGNKDFNLYVFTSQPPQIFDNKSQLKHPNFALIFSETCNTFILRTFSNHIKVNDCNLTLPLTIYKEQSLIQGATLKISFIEMPPGLSKDGTKNLIAGSQYNILAEISKRANVSLEFTERSYSHGFGMLGSNGTWNGLIGEAVHGTADIVPELIQTMDRNEYIDFSNVVYFSQISFCILQPESSRNWEGLVNSLQLELWLLLLATFCTLSQLISCILYFKLNKNFRFFTFNPKVLEHFIEIFLDQTVNLPGTSKLRFLFIQWICVCYFIGNTYKGNLVGGLTFQMPGSYPRNFKELHGFQPRYSKIIYSHHANSMVEKLFSGSGISYIKSLSKEWQVDSNSLESCMLSAVRKNVACIYKDELLHFKRAAQFEATPEFRNLAIIKPNEVPLPIGMGMTKGSIYREAINWYVSAAQSAHLLNLWNSMYIDKVERKMKMKRRTDKLISEKGCNSDKNECPLKSSDLVSALVVICAAYALCGVRIFWEMYHTNIKTFGQL